MFKVGDLVTDFTGKTNQGDWTLSSFKGQKVVIYFYPRDNTPGCIQESNDFNSQLTALSQKNTVVVGISHDNLAKHLKFSEKFDFNFPLIADEDKSISELFGVYQLKKFMGKESMGIVRSTFLIDENQQLQHEWRKVMVKGHVDQVISLI